VIQTFQFSFAALQFRNQIIVVMTHLKNQKQTDGSLLCLSVWGCHCHCAPLTNGICRYERSAACEFVPAPLPTPPSHHAPPPPPAARAVKESLSLSLFFCLFALQLQMRRNTLHISLPSGRSNFRWQFLPSSLPLLLPMLLLASLSCAKQEQTGHVLPSVGFPVFRSQLFS